MRFNTTLPIKSVNYPIWIIDIIPNSVIVFIYVKEMSQHIAAANALTRAQREFKMFQRTVILVSVCYHHWFSIRSIYDPVIFHYSTNISLSNIVHSQRCFTAISVYRTTQNICDEKNRWTTKHRITSIYIKILLSEESGVNEMIVCCKKRFEYIT